MKIINIKVIPNARNEKVLETPTGYKIYVKAPAIEGKANEVLIDVLANYLGLKKDKISIIRGTKSRNKVIKINV